MAVDEDELSGDRLNGCKGPSFRDKRDEALMRLFSETGLRASECLALKAGQSARRARQDQSVARQADGDRVHHRLGDVTEAAFVWSSYRSNSVTWRHHDVTWRCSRPRSSSTVKSRQSP